VYDTPVVLSNYILLYHALIF